MWQHIVLFGYERLNNQICIVIKCFGDMFVIVNNPFVNLKVFKVYNRYSHTKYFLKSYKQSFTEEVGILWP